MLYTAYWNFTENRPFLSLAVYLALVRYQQYQHVDIQSLSNIWKNNGYLTDLLSGQYTFVVDDYVVDVHTKEGRKQGKNRQEFVHQGAQINNIAPEFNQGYFVILEDIYANS